jgi:hypothetical protein
MRLALMKTQTHDLNNKSKQDQLKLINKAKKDFINFLKDNDEIWIYDLDREYKKLYQVIDEVRDYNF